MVRRRQDPVAWTLLTLRRYLGLPIFASRGRVCTKRRRCEAGAACHLRKHDGQLSGVKQRDWRRGLRQHDDDCDWLAPRQIQGRVVQDGRGPRSRRRRTLRASRVWQVSILSRALPIATRRAEHTHKPPVLTSPQPSLEAPARITTTLTTRPTTTTWTWTSAPASSPRATASSS